MGFVQGQQLLLGTPVLGVLFPCRRNADWVRHASFDPVLARVVIDVQLMRNGLNRTRSTGEQLDDGLFDKYVGIVCFYWCLCFKKMFLEATSSLTQGGSGFDDKIVSLYARGMTVREIQSHHIGNTPELLLLDHEMQHDLFVSAQLLVCLLFHQVGLHT